MSYPLEASDCPLAPELNLNKEFKSCYQINAGKKPSIKLTDNKTLRSVHESVELHFHQLSEHFGGEHPLLSNLRKKIHLPPLDYPAECYCLDVLKAALQDNQLPNGSWLIFSSDRMTATHLICKEGNEVIDRSFRNPSQLHSEQKSKEAKLQVVWDQTTE